jgi:hypothetical protein
MKLGKVSQAGDRPPGKSDDNDLPRLGTNTTDPTKDRRPRSVIHATTRT